MGGHGMGGTCGRWYVYTSICHNARAPLTDADGDEEEDANVRDAKRHFFPVSIYIVSTCTPGEHTANRRKAEDHCRRFHIFILFFVFSKLRSLSDKSENCY